MMSPLLGEFLGTMILILLGCGVNAGNTLKVTKNNDTGWLLITLGWGLAVAMGVFAVGKISGAHINPAVTLGFAVIGEFPWDQVPGYILMQMLGAMAGAFLVYLHFLPHWRKTQDPADKLGVFSTSPAIEHTLSNLLSEMIGTFVLVLGLLFIGANEFTEGLNPLVVGLLVVIIGMGLGGTTGYAINPARDLGPRITHFFLPIAGKGGSDWGYAWIPVVGPIIGGMYGAIFYSALFKQQFSSLFWVSTVVVLAVAIGAFLSERKS